MNLNLRRYAGVKDKLRMHISGVMYIKKYENESDELEDERLLLPMSKTEIQRAVIEAKILP